MKYRALGQTGLQVSVASFGTGSLGEMFGPLAESDALRLIDEALDSGINLIDTSPYYGSAEARLGKALTPAKRGSVILCTKAGRYGFSAFDFSPARIRKSVEDSLTALRTEFVNIDPVLSESCAELVRLKEEGKCRFIGMTGYPVKTFRRVIEETPVDVILTYGKGTLLDDSISGELLPVARQRGVGVMNAAAVALGLLSQRGSHVNIDHPAPAPVAESAGRMVALANQLGVDLAFLANQYAFQCVDVPTTVVGVGKRPHLQSALNAVATPVDHGLLDQFLALRPPAGSRQWHMGLPENN
jgi:aryl-alcohol dehydrogenase-like predicted oxidoreductase